MKNNAPTFNKKKHGFARLEDGTVEPLYYPNCEPRDFYIDKDGKWRMDFYRCIGKIQKISELIVEFM